MKILLLFCCAALACAQTVLTHVRVIDGTGAAMRTDQTIVISGGKIQAVGNAADVRACPPAPTCSTSLITP